VGYMYYGADVNPVEMPDRLLAHLKVLTTAKLRRGESFTVTWRHPKGMPEGRTSLWLQPAIPLKFVFGSAEAEKIDREYLESLAQAAMTSAGVVIDWDDAPAPLAGARRERKPVAA